MTVDPVKLCGYVDYLVEQNRPEVCFREWPCPTKEGREKGEKCYRWIRFREVVSQLGPNTQKKMAITNLSHMSCPLAYMDLLNECLYSGNNQEDCRKIRKLLGFSDSLRS